MKSPAPEENTRQTRTPMLVAPEQLWEQLTPTQHEVVHNQLIQICQVIASQQTTTEGVTSDER